jgi:hypothetical protein
LSPGFASPVLIKPAGSNRRTSHSFSATAKNRSSRPTKSNRRHHTERHDLDHHTPPCQHHPADADPPPNRSQHTGGTAVPSSWRTTVTIISLLTAGDLARPDRPMPRVPNQPRCCEQTTVLALPVPNLSGPAPVAQAQNIAGDDTPRPPRSARLRAGECSRTRGRPTVAARSVISSGLPRSHCRLWAVVNGRAPSCSGRPRPGYRWNFRRSPFQNRVRDGLASRSSDGRDSPSVG